MTITNKEKLSGLEINITGVAEVLGIDYKKASRIVREIRSNNMLFYDNSLYGKKSVAPIHLAPFLNLTEEEFKKIIFDIKGL